MRKHEIMYILNSSLDEELRKETILNLHKILIDNGATVLEVNEWGNRELAYEIEKQKRGYYVVVTLESDYSNAINEFNRLAKINKNVLRLMIVNKE